MKKKYYTIGEIARLGLIKKFNGEPHTNKPAISRIIRTMKYKTIPTPYGLSKAVSEEQINHYNDSLK